MLAGFAEILFTLITRIRVLVYAVGGGRTSLCSGGHQYHCAEVGECWDGSQDSRLRLQVSPAPCSNVDLAWPPPSWVLKSGLQLVAMEK